MSSTRPDPIVSVLVANRNGWRFLADALKSALRQTLQEIEVIVIDDASTDGSLNIARDFAKRDNRIRIFTRTTSGGAGAARNDGLAVAAGRWIAVLDNDDLMHPSRLELLTAEAEATEVDICADDLLIFQVGAPPTTLLSPRQRQLGWVSAAEFISSNKLLSKGPALGYLKPIFRSSFLRAHRLNYNTELSIGEDYDLVVQALAQGAKFRLIDTLGYFYRKHSNSLSHRVSSGNLANMLAADDRLQAMFDAKDIAVTRAFNARQSSIRRALNFTDLVTALKACHWSQAAKIALQNPNCLPLLGMPIISRLRQLSPKLGKSDTSKSGKQVCLISRQRLVGSINGSSAYLLELCKVLRQAGHQITLISPSPCTFGRWPFLILRSEMNVFDKIRVRGAWKIASRVLIAKDPRIAVAAARGVVAKAAALIGLKIDKWDRPAPYAIAEPWCRDDLLFIANHAPQPSDLIMADYAFTTPAIPYALNPTARSAVVMHDLFSARADQFRQRNLVDSVATLDEWEEAQLLRQADAIIAIQRAEAAKIRTLLPDRQVLLVPMASNARVAPQAGDHRTVLFIGSNTAPNSIGLRWFLEAAWPDVLLKLPDCQLLIAGSVASGFPNGFPGAQFLGIVSDLDPLYHKAGVVISPLTVGSGLKIKLIEALGQGKAIVATSVTVEGLEKDIVRAIAVHDEPSAFANAIVEMLECDDLRITRSQQALHAAREYFSPDGCYRQLLSFAAEGRTSTGLNRSHLSEAHTA